MALLENILSIIGINLGSKKLAKPFVFVSMLIGFIFFIFLGSSLIFTSVSELIKSSNISQTLPPTISMCLIGLLMLGLAANCAYFIKRCFE